MVFDTWYELEVLEAFSHQKSVYVTAVLFAFVGYHAQDVKFDTVAPHRIGWPTSPGRKSPLLSRRYGNGREFRAVRQGSIRRGSDTQP